MPRQPSTKGPCRHAMDHPKTGPRPAGMASRHAHTHLSRQPGLLNPRSTDPVVTGSTESRSRRLLTIMFGAHLHRAPTSLICLLVAAIPIVSSAAPSSGTPVVTNSCPPERASSDVICPQLSGNGDTY